MDRRVGQVVRVRGHKCELVTWSENRAVVKAVNREEHEHLGFVNVEWKEVRPWLEVVKG